MCYKKCGNIREICQDNCLLNNKSEIWGVNNPIYKGTKDFGCGDGIYKSLDLECILSNKENIIKVCNNNCVSTETLDCTNHCNYSYNIISDKNTNPLNFNTPNIKRLPYIKNNRGEGDNTQYIVYAFAISGIIFGIYILFTLNKSKT